MASPDRSLAFAPGLTRVQFAAILGSLVLAFVFAFGPIWRRPWDPDPSILWTYAPIPVLVAGCLAWNRRFRVGAWLLATFSIAVAKYLATASIYIAVLAFAGDPPKPSEPAPAASLPASRPAEEPEPEPTPLRDDALGAIEGVVIGADGAPRAGAFVAITEGLDRFVFRAPSAPVELTVGAGGFEPRLAAAHARQLVRIRSRDGALHTVNARSDAGRFLSNVPVVPVLETRFVHARGLLSLQCRVHPDETGAIVVFTHPFFAVTGADGRFALRGVPAGDVVVEAFEGEHGRAKARVAVAAGGVARAELKF